MRSGRTVRVRRFDPGIADPGNSDDVKKYAPPTHRLTTAFFTATN